MSRAPALVALLTLAAPAAAQIGQSTDILTGRVTSAAGQPLAQAEVEALALETQIRRTARTNDAGRYTILFTDGGGQYRVTIRYPGMQPVQAIVQRYADEDRLVFDAVLAPSAFTLEPIIVQAAPRPVRVPDRPTPGSIERALSPDLVVRLPIDDADLNVLATLVPGVVGLEASDSAGAAFSVAGLRPDANALTMDGLRFGSGNVPQEGLRATRVVTNTYDVARGQFSGGLIAATSRPGTNVVTGGARYTLRDDELAFGADGASPTAAAFTQHQVSLGLGGPLVRDRLFVFVSAQTRLRRDAQLSLLNASDDDLGRLGVHPDSVARFRDAVAALGVPPDLIPPADRATHTGSALLRLDWVATGSHTVTLRADWQGLDQEPLRVANLGLPQTGGTTDHGGAGVMAALTSRFATTLIHELRVYVARNTQETAPLLALPAGRVQVLSTLDDGRVAAGTLVFGGNAGMPTAARTRSIEATDELSWLPGSGRHRLRVGVLLRRDAIRGRDGPEGYGTYTYTSLAALDANRASVFRRVLPGEERLVTTTAWAGWAGDVWRVSRGLQVTYGLRVEGGSAGPTPAYNPLVDSLFGRRTDRLPAEWHVSPRGGFTWTSGTAPGAGAGFAPPRWILRGGAGEYRSPLPTGLLRSAQAGTGLGGSEQQLLCAGPGVPQADWAAWLADPGAVPGACATAPPALGGTAPAVTLFADGFEAPRSWRASFGVQRALTTLLRLSADVSWARGVRQYGFVDLNLNADPAFTLTAEANRPVYAPAAAIRPDGSVPAAAARMSPALGQVLEVRSDLASESRQLTLTVGGVTRRGVALQLAWTVTSARDQESGGRFGARAGFATATTAGDPTAREWGPSDFERRHSFLATITQPLSGTLELTAIGRLTSGAPYTPLVGGDINGDGARNDRAFVVPAAAALGRACLDRQLGTIAGRNSCRGPWQGTLDLQANWRPAILGLDRRLAVSLVTVNLLRGIDELVHGAEDARGWGLSLRPDPVLLAVTGFDPVAQSFQYALNERFGSTSGTAGLRAPFQIGIQARLTIGPDRQRAALDRLRAAGRAGGRAQGRGPGAAPAPGDFVARFTSLLVNPAERVLALDDSLGLGLDSLQRTRLALERDTLTAAFARAADSTRAAIERTGDGAGPQRVLDAIRPLLQDAWTRVLASAETVRGILTPAQWDRLPEDVRRPRRPGPGGAGRGPRQQ